MWLECIGVVSGWCCKDVHVYRFPHITYRYSTCISSFFAAASLLLCSFLKCFFILLYIYKGSSNTSIMTIHCTSTFSTVSFNT